MDFSREVTGARRLEMEDASAQGAMVISTDTFTSCTVVYITAGFLLFFGAKSSESSSRFSCKQREQQKHKK
jgi:hypothetical protein